METILIISTLVAFLFTIVIWKIWKWFEFEAWIAPAMMEDFCKAFLLVAPALVQAAKALTELGMVMERAKQQAVKHKLQPGGIVAETGKTPFPDGEISFDRE